MARIYPTAFMRLGELRDYGEGGAADTTCWSRAAGWGGSGKPEPPPRERPPVGPPPGSARSGLRRRGRSLAATAATVRTPPLHLPLFSSLSSPAERAQLHLPGHLGQVFKQRPAAHRPGRRYLALVILGFGGAAVGGAGESTKVSQAFQPSGRCSAPNSL